MYDTNIQCLNLRRTSLSISYEGFRGSLWTPHTFKEGDTPFFHAEKRKGDFFFGRFGSKDVGGPPGPPHFYEGFLFKSEGVQADPRSASRGYQI